MNKEKLTRVGFSLKITEPQTKIFQGKINTIMIFTLVSFMCYHLVILGLLILHLTYMYMYKGSC